MQQQIQGSKTVYKPCVLWLNLTNKKSNKSRFIVSVEIKSRFIVSVEIGCKVAAGDLPEEQEVRPQKGASAWPWSRVM